MLFDVQTEPIESGSRLLLSGKLDASTASQVESAINALLDEGETNVVINLSSLDFISSAGLGVLIAAMKKIRRSEGHLFLTEPSPTIYNVFKMTGLTRVFIIYHEEREAISTIRMMHNNPEF